MPHDLDRRFCIAPMLDWTDRHCRYWLRLLFPDALLYSEMVTTPALLHGDADRLLTFHPFEKPVALQLGGSDADAMARCAKIAQDYGYDEVNINVGCPSDRVQSGTFGACLMAKPHVVADCVSAMQAAVRIPVTVKTRIGIDEMEGYAPLKDFVACIADAGCNTVIVHARKAWLQGLSPRENREKPPLHYEYVYRLKQEFPRLTIVINGGIKKTADVVEHLRFVDGTMAGREAYQNPYALIDVQNTVFNRNAVIPMQFEIVGRYLPYIDEQLAKGVHLNHMTRHMLGLFQGVPGASQWRRHLSERANKPDAGIEVVMEALQKIKAQQNNMTGVVVNES
jgi:tRNA-dihydrouridine synthase A